MGIQTGHFAVSAFPAQRRRLDQPGAGSRLAHTQGASVHETEPTRLLLAALLPLSKHLRATHGRPRFASPGERQPPRCRQSTLHRTGRTSLRSTRRCSLARRSGSRAIASRLLAQAAVGRLRANADDCRSITRAAIRQRDDDVLAMNESQKSAGASRPLLLRRQSDHARPFNDAAPSGAEHSRARPRGGLLFSRDESRGSSLKRPPPRGDRATRVPRRCRRHRSGSARAQVGVDFLGPGSPAGCGPAPLRVARLTACCSGA
jgi:hypothetical protein